MADVTVRRCDRCGRQCSPGRRVTLLGHHDTHIDLCELCADALDVWLSLCGTPCFGEAYEHEIAAALAPPEGFPHVRNADGAIVVGGARG